jgi:DNA-binding transcriptional regulator YhcF (GntR family)
MKGQINSTFGTFQADMFESGLAAEVGANPFFVWLAIKAHADFQTGEAWPSIRRLAEITGISAMTVQRALEKLENARLLRVAKRGNKKTSTRYIARERLDVKFGNQLLCSIVVDYVPAQIRKKLERIKGSLKTGEHDPDLFAQVEIVPGEGFEWDAAAGVLRSKIHISQLPEAEPRIDPSEFAGSVLGLKVAGIRAKSAEQKAAKALTKK